MFTQKTAKPFSAETRMKKFPLKGLASMFSDDAEDPKAAETEETEETSHVQMAETALDEAEAAINSDDKEGALSAIATAREHIAQCEPDEQEPV